MGDGTEGKGTEGAGGSTELVPATPPTVGLHVGVKTGKGSRVVHLSAKGQLSLVTSKIPGGKHGLIEYARLSEDPNLKKLVAAWDATPNWRKRLVYPEELCIQAEISQVDVVREIAGVLFAHNQDLSNVIAAIAQPKVVEATVKYALKKDGIEDRRMMHQHSGFVPVPRGMNIQVTANAAAAAAAKTVQGEDSGLPDFEEDAIQTIAALREESE